MATRETKDGLGYIIQAISNIVEPKVADLRYDKTYRAKVTEKVDAGIYKVEVNRIEYQLKYNGDLSVGDIVRVKAPLNNFSDIYIEAEPSTGGGSGETSNYNDLLNKPILNTNNTEAQSVDEEETIRGTVKLHKISKTGNYNDLNNKPSLDFIPISDKGVANGVATLGANSKVISEQLPIASKSMLGAIKVGANLTIFSDGTLNALTSSGTVSDTLPIGSIVEWGSYIAPENWLLCDGRELKRDDYPDLFATIGTYYGEGDGSTTFNIPDRRGRFGYGTTSTDETLSDFSLGKTGGEQTHTLTTSEMPSHRHEGLRWGNTEPITLNSGSTSGYNLTYAGGNGGLINSITTTLTGGGQAHNNMPPYLVTNYIIKARQSAGVIATVVDSLNSTSTTDALSANQGKILKGYISDNDTMITTLQEDVINIEDNIAKIKSNYIPTSQKGNANGVATLGNDLKVPTSQLPDNLVTDKDYVHTDNNYTTADKNKLAGIEAQAQVNTIEKIQQNGTDLTITNKTVDIVTPTKTSDLTNDSGFLTTLPIASTTTLGGVKIGDNLSITSDGTLNATGGGSGVSDTPVGALMSYVGNAIPDKWLECDGSSVSSTDYSELYNVIGTTFGGDSSNFKLPDISGKFLVGLDSSDTDFDTMGKVGGEKTHKLTIAEMPSHTHKTWISDTAYSERGDGYQNYYYGQGRYYNNTNASGGGQAHNNMPPYFTVKYIIKAKK